MTGNSIKMEILSRLSGVDAGIQRRSLRLSTKPTRRTRRSVWSPVVKELRLTSVRVARACVTGCTGRHRSRRGGCPCLGMLGLQAQVKELQRLLGGKTMEGAILKEVLEIANGPKKRMLHSISLPKDVLR